MRLPISSSKACIPLITAGLACFALAYSARATDGLTEKQKIESLIKSVSELKDAKFIRNGKAYDGKAAADHMRRKWQNGRSHIKTARDFIRLAASKSSVSGKPYLIRFKDGKEVTSEKFLTEKLAELEKKPSETEDDV